MSSFTKIVKLLKKDYGYIFNTKMSVNEAYAELKSRTTDNQQIVLETAYNTYFSNKEYVQNLLICEALRKYLSEIAPARKGAKVKPKNKGNR